MTDTLAMERQARYQRGSPAERVEAAHADEAIHGRIHLLRGLKVMLDRDLAELYGVKAIRLREQVKRNPDRFPPLFMFQLTASELRDLVSQNAIPSHSHAGGSLPYAFTEHGILMLANVLRSGRATAMSIRIIELFVRMREAFLTHQDILQKLEQLEGRVSGHEEDIQALFDHLTALISPTEQSRRAIGFKPDDA